MSQCPAASPRPDALLPARARSSFHLSQPHSSLPRATIQEIHPEKAPGHLDEVLRAEVSMSPLPLGGDSTVASWLGKQETFYCLQLFL